jgi:hypothetical protein
MIFLKIVIWSLEIFLILSVLDDLVINIPKTISSQFLKEDIKLRYTFNIGFLIIIRIVIMIILFELILFPEIDILFN